MRSMVGGPSRTASDQARQGGGIHPTVTEHSMSIARARSLRRSLSPAEARLWNALRTGHLKPWHFRRQVGVGPYYADFASLGAALIVEVDGSGHFTDEAGAYDARRDAFLRSKGFRVLRVTTSDVLNRLDSVYAAILAALPAP